MEGHTEGSKRHDDADAQSERQTRHRDTHCPLPVSQLNMHLIQFKDYYICHFHFYILKFHTVKTKCICVTINGDKDAQPKG